MKKYTWKPDLPDHRDYNFSDLAKAVTVPPAKVDLRSQLSPVEDQGQLGSCTANALVGAMEYNENCASPSTFVDLSRLFIYWNERSIEGTVGTDSGAMIRDGIKSLASFGVCKEATWPYNIAKFRAKPTSKCFTEAKVFKISSYYRVDSTDANQMRLALANGNPFVFGFSVYDSFESATVATTGILNIPAKTEKLLGGHAVLAVGYDDATQCFLVRNSWGSNWGQSGYFTIPYAYLTNRNLADDLWVIIK